MHYHRREPKVLRTCEHCGKRFIVLANRIRYKACRFCSHRCYIASFGPRSKRVICPMCGTEFTVQMHVVRKTVWGPFCSRRCYGKWRSAHVKGDNCSWWRGGKTVYYQGHWKRQRQAAKRRDNWTCQSCHRTFAPRSRGIDVHHVIPYTVGQDPEIAHALDNLISLCRQCHNALHRGQERTRE